jgi:hypothetical protein
VDFAVEGSTPVHRVIAAGLEETGGDGGVVPVGVVLGAGRGAGVPGFPVGVVGAGVGGLVADVGAGFWSGRVVAVTAGELPAGVGGAGRTIR